MLTAVALAGTNGTNPGTKQNVRLVVILLLRTFQEPSGTNPGTKRKHIFSCMFLSILVLSRPPNIILIKETGPPPARSNFN